MPARAKTPRSRPAPVWKLPRRHEAETSQGLKVLVLPRGPLPLVTLRLVLQAGSAHDPLGKEGLSDFTSRLLRRGAAGMSAQQIDDAVEFVGASLSTGASEELFVLHLTTPAQHLQAMLDVLAALVVSPDFPADEVTSARQRTLAQLANDLDDPALLADRALTRAFWGRHAYGHDTSGTTTSVRSFSREDVLQFHREKLGPRVALLTVVGAVEPEATLEAVEKAFRGWKGGPAAAAPIPALEQGPRGGHVVLVDKPDQTQAQVRLAGPGFAFGTEPHFPSVVMNIVVGGGFTSRLINEIRVNRGLTYGISSGFDAMRADGAFHVSTFTKTGSTKEIIKRTLAELKKVRTQGIAKEELLHAQTYLAGLYPLRTETNDSIASTLAEVRTYGIGAEWIERYQERVRAVTLAQANEAASRFLFAKSPLVVVVGKAEALRSQVEGFGEVTILPAAEAE